MRDAVPEETIKGGAPGNNADLPPPPPPPPLSYLTPWAPFCRDTKDTLVVTKCGAEAIAFLKVASLDRVDLSHLIKGVFL